MSKKIVLSTAYLAPIQYYSKLCNYDEIYIELHENFNKQTYRNRCKIYGANGILNLSIPVKKLEIKIKIKDVQIDYDTNWQKMHWKSIESAYRSSPFFEFYEDDLKPFYKRKYKYLIDYNLKIQELILEYLDLEVKINFTNEYVHEINDDFRNIIHPKTELPDADFKLEKYTQVFTEKYGFQENLSIIDLLFNEGPNALKYLK